MYRLSGSESPWLRRLDHLICEVPDIEEAMQLFTERLGFPIAWPIGRFWPQGRTSGVALGGLNLEFLQLDEGTPSSATIRTLVFEPIDLAVAAHRYEEMGIPMTLREKWEPDPALLRLRGFDEDEIRTPQLICRNLYPARPAPFDFFLCDYAPKLKDRLSPSALPPVPAVTQVVLATPASDWPQIDRLFGTAQNLQPEIVLCEKPGDFPEVIEIRTERGPLDLSGWATRFRFT